MDSENNSRKLEVIKMARIAEIPMCVLAFFFIYGTALLSLEQQTLEKSFKKYERASEKWLLK